MHADRAETTTRSAETAARAIRKVAVVGAGVMGSGIAAHLANAGIPCLLLDIVPKPGQGDDPNDPAFRNRLAARAIAGLARQKPAPLMVPQAAALIEAGNVADDMPRIAECDWIVEAVKEDIAVKRTVFAAIEAHRRDDAIVSSNTSGLSVAAMLEGRSDSFRKHFLVTHFFNPVRYMRLLEIVSGPQTDPAVTARMTAFGERVLGNAAK